MGNVKLTNILDMAGKPRGLRMNEVSVIINKIKQKRRKDVDESEPWG